jgi:carbon storage regulator
MLVLSRKIGEQIIIGDNIVITLVEIRSLNVVRIGIEAPKEVPIYRKELLPLKEGKPA